MAEKGLDDLLTAAGRLRKLARVEGFGEGRLAGALRSRVAREGLPLRLHGFAGRERLAAELAGATATVLPARWPENCPLAILEAAELGRAARRRVAARHDPGGHADALLGCYRRAIVRAS